MTCCANYLGATSPSIFSLLHSGHLLPRHQARVSSGCRHTHSDHLRSAGDRVPHPHEFTDGAHLRVVGRDPLVRALSGLSRTLMPAKEPVVAPTRTADSALKLPPGGVVPSIVLPSPSVRTSEAVRHAGGRVPRRHQGGDRVAELRAHCRSVEPNVTERSSPSGSARRRSPDSMPGDLTWKSKVIPAGPFYSPNGASQPSASLSARGTMAYAFDVQRNGKEWTLTRRSSRRWLIWVSLGIMGLALVLVRPVPPEPTGSATVALGYSAFARQATGIQAQWRDRQAVQRRNALFALLATCSVAAGGIAWWRTRHPISLRITPTAVRFDGRTVPRSTQPPDADPGFMAFLSTLPAHESPLVQAALAEAAEP